MANNRELSQFANVVGYSDGNIGIGTDNPTDTGGYGQALDITGSSGAAIYLRSANGDTGQIALGSSDLTIRTRQADPIIFNTNNSERLRMTSDGRVLINTTSNQGGYLLQVKDGDISSTKLVEASGGNAVQMQRFRVHNVNNTAQSATLGGISAETVSGWGGSLTFHTKSANGTPNESVTEQMRITSGGEVHIGDSLGNNHAGKFQVIHEGGGNQTNDCLAFFETNANDWVLMLNSNEGGSANHYHIYFMEEGTVRGSIAGTHGSNVTYGQGSDYRWKENIIDLTGTEGIDICKRLRPRKYNWIKNREGTGQINTVDGFIAHEVQEAGVLGAVTGEKDAVNEDGSINGQMLDYGQMTPVLAAAIKGLIAKVETLEAQNTDLLARVTALENP